MIKQPPLTRSHYDVLKVGANATDADIKKAYLMMARVYHPDANPSKQSLAATRFREINDAYNALRTPERRARYDRYLQIQNTRKSLHLSADNDNKDAVKAAGLFNGLMNWLRPARSTTAKIKPNPPIGR